MLPHTFFISGYSASICSIMSFSICLFLRLLFIFISISSLAENFNVDELNLPNTKELVDELDKNDNDPTHDSSQSNHELDSVAFYSDTNNLIFPRKRTREPILEVNSYSELLYVIEKYRCVAVLYEDGSPRSLKAQHDLELIKADSNIFHISWRRIKIDTNNKRQHNDDVVVKENNNDVKGNSVIGDQNSINENDDSINNQVGDNYLGLPQPWLSRPTQCSVELHFDGNANSVRYPGRPDRQSAVFRWIIGERFCNLNRPLDIDHEQFEVLTRTFKSFIVIVTSKKITTSKYIIQRFSRVPNLCQKVGKTLVVTTSDDRVTKEALKITRRPPVVLNVVHGMFVVYEGNIQNMNSIINWINVDTRFNVKIAGENKLEQIITREDLALVLFTDESNQALNHLLKRVLNELEDSFGIATVEVSDLKVSSKYKVITFPSVLLFEGGSPKHYLGELRHADDSRVSDIEKATKVKEWVMSSLEAQDRIVVKEISPEAFKNEPNQHSHVLLKEHKDSIRAISLEYARLARENQELRAIIRAGQEALSILDEEEEISSLEVGNINGNETMTNSREPSKKSTKKIISHECKGCLASVGMAVWNCGTFEMDCIKGAIELGSECYPCVCEVIDALWPDDAPNCFKKEISKITKTQIDENLSSKTNGSSDTSTQREKSNPNVHDEL